MSVGYSAFAGTFSGGTFTITNATHVGASLTPTDTSSGEGTAGVLGDTASTPTFTLTSTFDGVTGTPIAPSHWTFLGTATINGVTGFVASAVNTSSTTVFCFFALGTPSPGTHSGTVTSPSNTSNWPGNWNLNNGTEACFVAGTMIATPSGSMAVETLKAGDTVLTASGVAVPVRWVGRSVVSRVFADPVRLLPVVIKAGALGDNLPVRDLSVSPGHALMLDGVLIQAGALVNGTSIVRDTAAPMVFTYYHVELDNHDVIVAEGIATESFLDGIEQMNFENIAERPAPLATVQELALPRAKSARQVPQATRDLIAARAAAIGSELAAAA